jgi:hypothetical protein
MNRYRASVSTVCTNNNPRQTPESKTTEIIKPSKLLLTSLAAAALAVGSAQANVIVSYAGSKLGLFSDTGTLLTTYSTTLVNPQAVVTDSTGHVYVAEYGTPGAYNGNVKMYDIATGAFIRNVVAGSYGFTGLAFNPANAGEIIVMGQYNAGNSQLGRWDTSTTGSNVAANSALGAPYAGLYYNPTISGGAPEGIYAAAPAGVVQQYDSTSLAWGSPTIPDIGVSGPNGITGIGTDLFFASNGGLITKDSGGVLTTIVTSPGDNYYGITTDGTDLWVAQYSSGYAGRYSTSGTLTGYFALTNPAGIAYTTIPEPSAYGMVMVAGAALLTRRKRRNPIA